ncbi:MULTISPECIES: type I-E CRISPR-associated protein Cse1/CasA [unclassified Endozoicomonas]|uniref:type I-E CRISPR-associated protein Cse1/CasA n=1 Tax=unclassified Endozoicomonas TaxID=2644528 RepID=UPI003BB63FF1
MIIALVVNLEGQEKLKPFSLLTEPWIPVQYEGARLRITYQQLLCGEKKGDLCLPRDDLELACLQLLVAITQVCFTPFNRKELLARLKKPLPTDIFLTGVEDKKAWFDLNHPDTPFMQIRGVKASEPTPMDKLLAGVADGTNKTFINPQGLAEGLCGSCTAIALFNMANNCPSMGGGFKGSLRGSTPITQLITGPDLRITVWLNVLHQDRLNNSVMPWYKDTAQQAPNYVDTVKAGEKICATNIGLNRGLLWQPAHFELLPAEDTGCCSVCNVTAPLYKGFNKAKFKYTVEGVWPHPLSARSFKIAKGKKEEKFPSFTTTAPGWTQLSRLVVAMESKKEGQNPAPVLIQIRDDNLIRQKYLQFIIGGYRNKQATVLERRHEFFSLADGWAEHGEVIHHIIETGLGYKTALRRALYLFAEGIKDKNREIKGAGVNLCQSGDDLYFQQTEQWIRDIFADIDFSEPLPAMDRLRFQLKQTIQALFDQLTQPYRQEPKMLKALALARRSLNKSLADLQPVVTEEN